MSDPISPLGVGAPAPVSTEQAEELKQKIQEALIEIRQAKDWDEYTTMDDQAEIELLEAKLKGTLTLINHFLATGEWGVPSLNGNGQVQNSANSDLLRDLRPGWNGDFTPRDALPEGLSNLFSTVGAQYPGAEFEGTIYIQDSGNPENPPQLVFQASENTVKIEAFNYGTNIVYVETYTDEAGAEKQRFWVGVDHVTKLNAVIAVSGHNLTYGIEMDFHRVFRIGDGSHGFREGTVGGIRFIGSDFNDDITGTQGDDDIIGLKGSDTLSGEGGIDIISGDSSGLVGTREMAEGITAEMIREQLGLRNDIADGDDTIDGGTGTDILSGDGGVDTGFKTDPDSGPYIEPQTGIEGQLESRTTTPPSGWLTDMVSESQGWGNVRTVRRGEVEISETGTLDENSELTIQMPDGFDYAYADDRDESIYITFVKHVDGQPPQTFTLIVCGALRDRSNLLSPFTLHFKGTDGANIIDFHDIDMRNNLFKVEGMGNDDMILAPENDLNKYGLELSDLLDPANRYQEAVLSDELSSVVPDHDEEGPDGQPIHAVVDGDEIVISRDRDQEAEELRDAPRSVQIDPSGYDRAYVMRDGEDNLKVILVRQGVNSSSPQTLVIRIDNYREFQGDDPRDMSWLVIKPEVALVIDPQTGLGVGSEDSSGTWGGQITYLLTEEINDQPVAGNIIDAGAGSDFAFYHEGDTAIGVESEVVAHYTPGSSLPPISDGDGDGGGDDDDDDPPPPPPGP